MSNKSKKVKPCISLEKSLWKKGFINVAGVDEAGKGPWAGPVTAGAVIIHSSKQIVPEVYDSKLMTKIQREKAFIQIINKSSAYGIGIVSEKEIDDMGIQKAVKKAMINSLKEIERKFGVDISYVLIDGSKTMPITDYASQRIKRGGLYHYSISAASILAKVTRDRIMCSMAKKYPDYQFEKHVGYGTRLHLDMLKKYGACPIHRKSFSPIKNILTI
ncbi:MAG: ribonuclease HII [Candidatus Levybacteria bacterium]|nr:ribonuclease HII [Candidatus Levybacteria bacterium]